MDRVALITGANRGLGKETAHQLAKLGYHVLVAARTEAAAQKVADEFNQEKLLATPIKLDVTLPEDIFALKEFITTKFGRVDILVNNAGIFPDEPNESAFQTKLEVLKEGMTTNVYGPFLLCQSIIPLMQKNHYGRVVNLSSGMGQLTEMNGGSPGYRISKTAINAVTRIFSDETSDDNILINSVCPGWVKTDMGGPGAELEVSEGVDSIVWLATLPDNGPRGGFFRERKKLDW